GYRPWWCGGVIDAQRAGGEIGGHAGTGGHFARGIGQFQALLCAREQAGVADSVCVQPFLLPLPGNFARFFIPFALSVVSEAKEVEAQAALRLRAYGATLRANGVSGNLAPLCFGRVGAGEFELAQIGRLDTGDVFAREARTVEAREFFVA